MKNTQNYYSTSTVAEMLNVDRATVWRYARKGYFDIIYIGKTPRVCSESLENYLKNAKKYKGNPTKETTYEHTNLGES